MAARIGKSLRVRNGGQKRVEIGVAKGKRRVEEGTWCSGASGRQSQGSSHGRHWQWLPRSGAGGSGGLANEASKIEGIGENIAHVVGFGTVVETEPGGTLEVTTTLVGVTALGVALSAEA